MPGNHLSKTISESIENIDGQHINGEQITKDDKCRIATAALTELNRNEFIRSTWSHLAST